MSGARVVVVAGLAAFAAGCAGGSGSTGGVVSGGPRPATLEDVQVRVFTPRCAISGCHVGPDAPFDLDLGTANRSEANLIGIASREVGDYLRVERGSATDSYLYMKVTGDPRILGDRMPAYGAFLGADDVERIRVWIDQGAR